MDDVQPDPRLFHDAADFTPAEVAQYRSIMFPPALGNSTHTPFFSVENAPEWMTARGYVLFNDYDPAAPISFDFRNATVRQLRDYRTQIVGPIYAESTFFQVDHTENWVCQGPFNTWMRYQEEQRGRTRNRPDPFQSHRAGSSSLASSPAPSRAMSRNLSSPPRSPPHSRSASMHSVGPWHSLWAYSSHQSSRANSAAPSRASSAGPLRDWPYTNSRGESAAPPSRSQSRADSVHSSEPIRLEPVPPGISTALATELSQDVPSSPGALSSIAEPVQSASGSRKKSKKAKSDRPPVAITRELYVDRLERVTSVGSTWTVPRDCTAYLVDLSATPDVLKEGNKTRTIDAYIKAEDQDAWEGSTGHVAGDVWVTSAFNGEGKRVRARRAQLTCKGVNVCEYTSEEIFGDCERYEPDSDAMQDLWIHELDANEREAASPEAILSRFYVRVIQSKCKIPCDGVPVLIQRSHGPNAYSQLYFVGCSSWKPSERWSHLYHHIPVNVDEDEFRYVFENDGRLPNGAAQNFNEKCVLTTHPRLALKRCCFTHVVNGVILPAKLLPRKCDTELVALIPVRPFPGKNWYEWRPEYEFQAILYFRNAHNHPIHPQSKPSSKDKQLLDTAMDALGPANLTVQTLLNAQSTSVVYSGKQVSEVSPAFADVRKVRDRIAERRKNQFPGGTDFRGVQEYIRTVERARPMSERYIHAAISKSDFNLVVTLHPQLAKFIHEVLAHSWPLDVGPVPGNEDINMEQDNLRLSGEHPDLGISLDPELEPNYEVLNRPIRIVLQTNIHWNGNFLAHMALDSGTTVPNLLHRTPTPADDVSMLQTGFTTGTNTDDQSPAERIPQIDCGTLIAGAPASRPPVSVSGVGTSHDGVDAVHRPPLSELTALIHGTGMGLPQDNRSYQTAPQKWELPIKNGTPPARAESQSQSSCIYSIMSAGSARECNETTESNYQANRLECQDGMTTDQTGQAAT
ncbi:hypothetical protein FB45DRAFT_868661 [Roridomyces roridus]|uniref:Uncharacterized protein n=1 Tax=Roridomyces roridus TaxID=1738132 RepID=A0AAD7FMP3_9AGAR|nr:hypothetical protein FB45DRAFT_868661 [Roridomyces roridus]